MNYNLLLVDSANLIHAMYYYDQIGIVDTFIEHLLVLEREHSSGVMVVLFDHPSAREVRRKLLPTYKSNREKMPGVGDAVANCYAAVQQASMLAWADPNHEADDLIASLVKAYKADNKILIYGRDKDLYANLDDGVHQLTSNIVEYVSNANDTGEQFAKWNVFEPGSLNEQMQTAVDNQPTIPSAIPEDGTLTVSVTAPSANPFPGKRVAKNLVYMTPEKVFEEHGVWPRQWIDYCTLKGDLSDSISGVKGIGEKTAQGLISKYGSLEQVVLYAESVDLTKARKQNLLQAIADKTLDMCRILVSPQLVDPIPKAVADAIDAGLVTKRAAAMRAMLAELDNE